MCECGVMGDDLSKKLCDDNRGRKISYLKWLSLFAILILSLIWFFRFEIFPLQTGVYYGPPFFTVEDCLKVYGDDCIFKDR